MVEETKGQVAEDIKTDETSGKQPEDTNQGTEITAEKAYELAQGLQKGYTMTRQDIAEIRENLNQIVEAINSQKNTKEGEDEYLTVGKLREILAEQSKVIEAKDTKADEYVEKGISQLRAEGIIKTDAEEKELINYAISKKETDLFKAAERWQEIKQAREEGKKEVSKKEARQEEGSKVGTSSKSSEGNKGVNYQQIHNTDWSQF